MCLWKIGKVLLLFIFVISLSACNYYEDIDNDKDKDKDRDNDVEELITLYTISLYNGEEVIKVFENIEANTLIELPVLEEDGMLFVGYEIEDSIYYDEYTVTSDISLYACFEVVTEVFEYQESEDESTLGITGYTGNATHLKIPQTINGKVVSGIFTYAFEESNLVEVIIPVDAYVNAFAFKNSTELTEVSFYGNYLLTESHIWSQPYYDEIIADNPDTCIITEGSIEEGFWTFSDGCPIKEVISKNPPIIVEGIEYHSYNVIVDKNYSSLNWQSSFGSFAFSGATSLVTVQVPRLDAWFLPSTFEGCISLEEIIVDEESESFTVLDGVLYNKDLTKLLYYPPSKEGISYTLLDSLSSINPEAFADNMFLETIIISEYYTEDFNILGLNNLKEIIVNENNEYYYAIDGILFKENELVKYPAAKSGDSYTLPAGILSIGPNAFTFNKYLETIGLGSELTKICPQAFYGAEMLSELNIPSSVIYIGTCIVVNSNINTIIINRSFLIDGSITSIYVGFGPVDTEIFKVYVPDDSIDEYLAHMFWSNYDEVIYSLSEYNSE